ncbi:MAG: methyl-accepting chemotaxis protein [Elusimicrobia bacterium]|nr:methyl-accepting chemotaxis protein [Elusimicrobiota bacterium]
MPDSVRHKRRIIITHKKYQFKYTFYILISMVLVAGVISLITFFGIYPILSEKLSKAVTEPISKELAKALLNSYWISVVFLIFLAGFFGIFLSHKIVGPINRMTSIVNDIEKGNLSKRIYLRKHDEFVPLANAINKLLDSLKKFMSDTENQLNEFETSIKKLSELLEKENFLKDDIKIELNEIRKKLKSLQNSILKYKNG